VQLLATLRDGFVGSNVGSRRVQVIHPGWLVSVTSAPEAICHISSVGSPTMKVRDVIKALEREGWRLDRQTTKRASIVNTATPTDLGPSRWLAS